MTLLIDAFYGNVINVHEKTETKVLRDIVLTIELK